MKNKITSLLITTFSLASCSQSPVLDTSKNFSYDFGQPERSPVSSQVSGKLGTPGLDSHPNEYYSANGHVCRKLASNQAACYVDGVWLKAADIIASGG